MLTTYKAILRGNTLEWEEESPITSNDTNPIPVHVTLLTSPHKSNGKELARIFEELAALNAFSDIEDPKAWQQEMRQERSLPGREA